MRCLHREILEDALLDLVEAVVVGIEDRLRPASRSFLTLRLDPHGIDSNQSR